MQLTKVSNLYDGRFYHIFGVEKRLFLQNTGRKVGIA